MCNRTVRLLSFVLVLSLAAVGWSGVSQPVPADGTVIEETWANIAWTPGNTAASFDVYFGDNSDDVRTAQAIHSGAISPRRILSSAF